MLNNGYVKRVCAKRQPVIKEDHALIPLSKGAFAIVDLPILPEILKANWYLRNGYASTGSEWMHRVVAKTPKGLVADHINGNKLDNRACNLRNVTAGQNVVFAKDSYHGVDRARGVRKRGNKWVANYCHNWLGSFDTEEEARDAVRKFCNPTQ